MSVSEARFQNELLLALGKRDDVRVWRQNSGHMAVAQGGTVRGIKLAPKGASDIIGVCAPGGWLLSIEVKKDGGKTTPEQDRWAEMVNAMGGIHILAEYIEEDTMEQNLHRVRLMLDERLALRRDEPHRIRMDTARAFQREMDELSIRRRGDR